jgi:hypothetical protein
MSGGGRQLVSATEAKVKPLSGMWANVCATGELLKSRKFHFPKSHALHLPHVELRIIWVSPLCPANLQPWKTRLPAEGRTLEPSATKPVNRGEPEAECSCPVSSFTSQSRIRTARSSLTPNLQWLMPPGLRTKLAEAGDYRGFAIKVTDEQGNRVVGLRQRLIVL